MAKVFAVIEGVSGELELISWKSAAAFYSEGNSFVDERFVKITTTDDYKKQGMYRSPEEYVDPQNPTKGFRVIKSKKDVLAHNMLHEALKSHFKGQVFDVPHY